LSNHVNISLVYRDQAAEDKNDDDEYPPIMVKGVHKREFLGVNIPNFAQP
jgi:hypothetical protein